MTNEQAEEVRGFVGHDGNESFEPHLERTCPSCGMDRKQIVLAVVSGGYEDRCAAGSILGSCSLCAQAVENILDELARRREARQPHCLKCHSTWLEETDNGKHCLTCGFTPTTSKALPFVEDHPQHYSKRKELAGATR